MFLLFFALSVHLFPWVVLSGRQRHYDWRSVPARLVLHGHDGECDRFEICCLRSVLRFPARRVD